MFLPGCREHTHAGRCFQMHSGHSCQLRRTAGVPGAARGHSGTPERTDSHIYSFCKINHCLLTKLKGNNHRVPLRKECAWAGQHISQSCLLYWRGTRDEVCNSVTKASHWILTRDLMGVCNLAKWVNITLCFCELICYNRERVKFDAT